MSLFSIVIKLLRKLKRIIFIFKDRLKNRIRICLRYLSNSKLYIFMIKKIYKIQSIFYIIRYLEKMLDYLGFRIYQYKLVKRSKKTNEDFDLVNDHTRYLETYFNSSQDAKNIFKDLNKYS